MLCIESSASASLAASALLLVPVALALPEPLLVALPARALPLLLFWLIVLLARFAKKDPKNNVSIGATSHSGSVFVKLWPFIIVIVVAVLLLLLATVPLSLAEFTGLQ